VKWPGKNDLETDLREVKSIQIYCNKKNIMKVDWIRQLADPVFVPFYIRLHVKQLVTFHVMTRSPDAIIIRHPPDVTLMVKSSFLTFGNN